MLKKVYWDLVKDVFIVEFYTDGYLQLFESNSCDSWFIVKFSESMTIVL